MIPVLSFISSPSDSLSLIIKNLLREEKVFFYCFILNYGRGL
jgi:hypothetical protein